MSVDLKAYQQSVAEIARRATNVRRTLIEPFLTDSGFCPVSENDSDIAKKAQILESAILGTYYENFKNGKSIASIHARALQDFYRKFGRWPENDLLASCDKAIENVLLFSTGREGPGFVMESADMSSTEGIIMRDRLVSLVLPVQLQAITSAMCTFVPGEFNQSVFYRINRVAGSTFGNLKKGDPIDWTYDGLYSSMDRCEELAIGDGNTKNFAFNSNSVYGVVYPMKRKRTRIYYNRKRVAEDNGNGILVGTFYQSGTAVIVSGDVDYTTGTVNALFSAAPINNAELHIGFDVDIEASPTLIPKIDHVMQEHTLYPHESAIAGHATIQAIWALRRELGQDIDNLTMIGLRNLLTADKDKKHLHDMWFHCTNSVEWDRTVPTALTKKEHYESVILALLEVDNLLRKQNGVAGLTGMVGGTQAVNLFRSLDNTLFQITPNYRSQAQPHYVGRIAGQWDLFCDPLMDSNNKGTNSLLCYARGIDHGQTAYVVGDAIPALTFRHPVLGDLVQNATMWDLAYRDMQPFDGEAYLCKLIFTSN